jgi:hypothetical protein
MQLHRREDEDIDPLICEAGGVKDGGEAKRGMPQGVWTLILYLWAPSLHYKAAPLNLSLLEVLYRDRKVIKGCMFLIPMGKSQAPER